MSITKSGAKPPLAQSMKPFQYGGLQIWVKLVGTVSSPELEENFREAFNNGIEAQLKDAVANLETYINATKRQTPACDPTSTDMQQHIGIENLDIWLNGPILSIDLLAELTCVPLDEPYVQQLLISSLSPWIISIATPIILDSKSLPSV